MSWTYQIATIATSKLPTNWVTQGLTMAYKVTYLAKSYLIPLAFVVNSNQTRIHLVLNANEKTWEPKGMKHVQVLSLEDMKQVTMVVSSSTTSDLLPPQIMFISFIGNYDQTTKGKQFASMMVRILLLVKTKGCNNHGSIGVCKSNSSWRTLWSPTFCYSA